MGERGPLCFHVFTCVLWFPKLGGLGFSPYQSKGGRESRRIKIIAKHLPFTCHAREPHESLVIGVTTRRPVDLGPVGSIAWCCARAAPDSPERSTSLRELGLSLEVGEIQLELFGAMIHQLPEANIMQSSCGREWQSKW